MQGNLGTLEAISGPNDDLLKIILKHW